MTQTMPAGTPPANGSAPSSSSLQSLAGAFIAIQVANKAISLQPRLPTVDIPGFEDVNTSLATAQGNGTWWTATVSANVQNQLQHIVEHSDLYTALAPDLEQMINRLMSATPDNPPDGDLLANLSDELLALQDSVQSILYGDGATRDQPAEDSVMGTYKQLTQYQQKVQGDETTFAGLKQKAASSQTGIASQLTSLQDEITSLRTAISHDQAMIAGGAAAVVTGIGLIVAGVALAPETAGAGFAVSALGVAAVAGGVAADTYALLDLGKKQDKVSEDLVKIHDLHQESAALTAIHHASDQVAAHAKTIYGALGTIVTNWQQMDNDIADAVSGIASINNPDSRESLGRWIQQQGAEDHTPSYHVMGAILHSKMVAPQNDWDSAAKLAHNLLNGIANVRHVTLPPATMPTLANIAAAA